MHTYYGKLINRRLTEQRILATLAAKKDEIETLNKLREQSLGKNQKIKGKIGGAKLQIPYAKTLVTMITGFLYKPGLITYGSTNEIYENIMKSFEENEEQGINTQLGKNQSIYGEAYEIHWIEKDGTEFKDRFAVLEPQELTPIYSEDVKPKLIAAIRRYKKLTDEKEVFTDVPNSQMGVATLLDLTTEYIDVYYADVVETFEINATRIIRKEKPVLHPYGQVPLAIFRNNNEAIGDIEPIISLLDAYDQLVSQAIDDEEKFADAILLVFGKVLDKEAIDKLEKLRVIDDLDKDEDSLQYLTKDQKTSRRDALITIIREEIYRQSFIPDMTNPAVFGQKSGEALLYLFSLFELLAATKETHFRIGIKTRLELTGAALTYPKKDFDSKEFKVTFARNLPRDNSSWADIFEKLWGKIPAKFLVPALPFIQDPQPVIKAVEEEQEKMKRLEPATEDLTKEDAKL